MANIKSKVVVSQEGSWAQQGINRRDFLSLTTMALAWLLARSPSIVPIPGTRYQIHLMENLAAQNIQLSKEDVQEIETCLSKYPVYGDRMGEAHMSSIDYTF